MFRPLDDMRTYPQSRCIFVDSRATCPAPGGFRLLEKGDWHGESHLRFGVSMTCSCLESKNSFHLFRAKRGGCPDPLCQLQQILHHARPDLPKWPSIATTPTTPTINRKLYYSTLLERGFLYLLIASSSTSALATFTTPTLV